MDVSELPRRQTIVVLPGDTTTTSPTLEPRSVERIFLRRVGKFWIRKFTSQWQLTMMTSSIL